MEMRAIAPGERRQRSPRSIMKSRVASAIGLTPAFYTAGIVLFALTDFKDYAGEAPQLLRYVVVPGLVTAIFVAVALFGSRSSRLMLGGMGIAILLGLFAFEARLESGYASAVVDLTHMPSGDVMQRLGVAEGLPPAHTVKKFNREAGVTRTEDAVLSGVPGKRVLLCSAEGRPVIYQADRYGFRNPDEAYDRPIDRLLLGDSFVEGVCLPDGQSLVDQVRARGGNVVGLGTRGAGPLLELAMLGRFGPAIRPKSVVIVFYEGNDWENLGHETAYPWLRGITKADTRFGPAVMPEAVRDRMAATIQDWEGRARPSTFGVLAKANFVRNSLALHQTWAQLGLAYPKAARDIPIYDRILARSKAMVEAWGGRLAILYVPQTSRFTGLLPHGFVYNEIRDRVTRSASKSGIPVIDLSPVFERAPERLALYGPDGHLSARGARVAAGTLDHALAIAQGAAR